MKPICEINNYGDKLWRLNNKLHREDGPAYEGSYGDKYWYINGEYINCKDNQEFLRMIKLMIFL